MFIICQISRIKTINTSSSVKIHSFTIKKLHIDKDTYFFCMDKERIPRRTRFTWPNQFFKQ